MNLNARNKNGRLDLWQTPTHISYTILPSHISSVKGKKAKEALKRYREYVKHYVSSISPWTPEELNRQEEVIKRHLEYIDSQIDILGLEVWVM